MEKAFDCLAKTLYWILVALGSALIVVVVLQVISRYILVKPIFWTEEVSRFLFIGITAFGAPLAVRSNQYIRLDIFLDRLGPRYQRIALIAMDIVVAAFLCIVAYYALNLIRVGRIQKSSVLRIPMSYMFSLMLLSPALTALFFLENAYKRFRARKEAA
jgi:TRAP-type C4-dicarboxylate transport system, small permease component